jgi:hypothetical protein
VKTAFDDPLFRTVGNTEYWVGRFVVGARHTEFVPYIGCCPGIVSMMTLRKRANYPAAPRGTYVQNQSITVLLPWTLIED